MRCVALPFPGAVLMWSMLLSAAPALAQTPPPSHAKSGPRAIDACGVLTQAELETVIGQKVKPERVPPSTPTSAGVSVCMYSSDRGQAFSITTYSAQAVANTHSRTLQGYYDSAKTSNANLAGKPPQVLPGVAKHATYFVSPRDAGDVVLVLRNDCVVTINAVGLQGREQAHAVAKAAGH